MNQYNVAKKLLDLATFPAHNTLRQVTRSHGSSFICIPGQFGPRWIVPADPNLGMSVINEWQPYNFLSKLKWRLLLLAYRLFFLTKIPGVTCLQTDIGKHAEEIPVIYVGSPGKKQKAVISLVSIKTGSPQRLMKIALGDKAKESIQQEALILRALAQMNLPIIIPTLIEISENSEWAIQTVVKGHLSGRRLTIAHVQWLLQLPISTKTTTLDQQQKKIQKKLHSCRTINAKLKQQFLKATSRITGGSIPLLLVHGDFAPWNLKVQTGKDITAIDWEDAVLSGLPMWDICHFFFMQDFLFTTTPPFETLKENGLVHYYLKELGLKKETLFPLMLLYLLCMIVDKERITSESYKRYLIKQVQTV